MTQKLKDKVAVITGGSSGIGLATARRFVAEGASVFITGRRQHELDAAVRAIEHNVTAVQGDVAQEDDLDRLIATVKDQKGRIDVLFANAGVYETGPLGEITEAHFDKLFNVNVKGLVFTVQKSLPLMSRGGTILLTGSVAGSKGIPSGSIYGATKAAVRLLARSWMVELNDRGIRVNVISPGPIETPMAAEVPQELMQELMQSVPMGRLGNVGEVASAAVFLASEESSYTNGAELFVDGGAGQI